MVGGSIRAAAKAAMVGGYRSAAYMRRAVIPSTNSSSSSSAADSRKASTLVADDWVIPDREVFGPVPTHEEAMAATLDLSEAFEMCVLSLCSIAFFPVSVLSLCSIALFSVSLPSLFVRSLKLFWRSLYFFSIYLLLNQYCKKPYAICLNVYSILL
jgi:hypothetical protein